MILRSKSVSVIVALVLTALSGLVIVQVLLLGNAMELKEQAFRSNVMTTMGRISASLATNEAVEIAFHTIGDNVTGVPTQITATITTGEKRSFDVEKLFKKEIYKDFEGKVSIKDVTPYLIRRAEENTSIAGQTGRELSLILTEQLRRKSI